MGVPIALEKGTHTVCCVVSEPQRGLRNDSGRRQEAFQKRLPDERAGGVVTLEIGWLTRTRTCDPQRPSLRIAQQVTLSSAISKGC